VSSNESETLQKSLGRAFIDKSWMRKWHKQFDVKSAELDIPVNEREKARDLLKQMVKLRSLDPKRALSLHILQENLTHLFGY
jgi:hypothetical protein